MKLPVSWINEIFSHPLSLEDIETSLNQLGIEVDGILPFSPSCEGVISGTIHHVCPHPHSDKLSIATVFDGKKEFSVVCGASNCRKGLTTAFAPVGSTVSGIKIAPKEVAKVPSEGMLCSGKELGISSDHQGILELPHLPLGTSLETFFSDTILEVSVTPNLGHCLSLQGIARELRAALDIPFTLKTSPPLSPAKNPPYTIHIETPNTCDHYAYCLIEGVDVAPSPAWLQKKLSLCGLRSINNIVDITHLVMMELGHPLHAFDADFLKGQTITVRYPKKEELGSPFPAIDGESYPLKEEHLLICDEKGPIAFGGVMGGKNSQVQTQTRRILLEGAYFHPGVIRSSSKASQILSEASRRFERGCDPLGIKKALETATELIREIASDKTSFSVTFFSHIEKPFQTKEVLFAKENLNKLIGHSFENPLEWLEKLEFTPLKGTCGVSVPSYRHDVHGEQDLAEEIARLYGYDKLPAKISSFNSPDLTCPSFIHEKALRDFLNKKGLQEMLCCDLISPKLASLLPGEGIPVLKPTSQEQSVLRPHLLPGLLQVVKRNLDHQHQHIHGFEMGKVFSQGEKGFVETPRLAFVITGNTLESHWDRPSLKSDFFDLKGLLEDLFQHFSLKDSYEHTSFAHYHPHQQCQIFVGTDIKTPIGSMGQLHPSFLQEFSIEVPVFYGEIDTACLIPKTKISISSPPLFPSSERDWTLTLREESAVGAILEFIQTSSFPLLETVSLSSIYWGKQVEENKKNVTFHFVYRSLEKTLSHEDVEKAHHHLMEAVTQTFQQAFL